MGLKTLPTKKTYPATMDSSFDVHVCWAFFEMLRGRRKEEEELEEDQQETERRMVQ